MVTRVGSDDIDAPGVSGLSKNSIFLARLENNNLRVIISFGHKHMCMSVISKLIKVC